MFKVDMFFFCIWNIGIYVFMYLFNLGLNLKVYIFNLISFFCEYGVGFLF